MLNLYLNFPLLSMLVPVPGSAASILRFFLIKQSLQTLHTLFCIHHSYFDYGVFVVLLDFLVMSLANRFNSDKVIKSYFSNSENM